MDCNLRLPFSSLPEKRFCLLFPDHGKTESSLFGCAGSVVVRLGFASITGIYDGIGTPLMDDKAFLRPIALPRRYMPDT